MSDKGDELQSPEGGRRSFLPPGTEVISLHEAEANVTNAIKSGNIASTDISEDFRNAKPPDFDEPKIPHGKARVYIAGGVLAIALIGPCTPWVPDNVKTGFLAIAGSVSSSLFKGFERN